MLVPFPPVEPRNKLGTLEKLLRIDAEGYEMNAALGMQNAMTPMRDAAFVVEITPEWLEQHGTSASAQYNVFLLHVAEPTGDCS